MEYLRLGIVGFFWFFGFIGLVSGNVISGLCFAAIGFLISPFSNKLVLKQFQKAMPVWGKIVLAVVLFFGYVSTASAPKASTTSASPTPMIEQTKVVLTPEPTAAPTSDPAEIAGEQVYLAPTISPSPTQAPLPTKVPTPKPILVSTPKPVNSENWVCNCAKTCPQMSSCAEAQFQLNTCGCSIRDKDHDGIACNAQCNK